MEDREAVTPGKKFPRRKVEKYFQKLQKNGTELYVDGEKVSPSQAAAYASEKKARIWQTIYWENRAKSARSGWIRWICVKGCQLLPG